MSRSRRHTFGFVAFALSVSTFGIVGHALPGGALSCASGTEAICGPSSTHCTNPQGEGSGSLLSDGSFEVLWDGVALTEGAEQNFDTLRDYELTLQAASPNTFRGFLIRLGDPIPENDFPPRTTLAFIVNDDNTQFLTLCESVNMVGGITHKTKADKESVTTIIRMDERAVGMVLDVTVVVQNQPAESLFYYSNFTMNAFDVTSSPSMSPTNPDGTTNPPIAPSPGPSTAPVSSSPTDYPTATPTVSSAWGALTATRRTLLVTLVCLVPALFP